MSSIPTLQVRQLGALELECPHNTNMRERHLAQILGFLRSHGPSSRALIAAECGLGISTMSELIGELRGRRLVSESDPVRTQSAGRPLREVQLDAGHWLVGGLQLEENVVRAKLATLDGREVNRQEAPVPDPAELRPIVRSVLSGLLAARPTGSQLIAMEVGLPGAIRRSDGWVMLSCQLDLERVALGEDLRELVSELAGTEVAVGIDNDCNFAALSVCSTHQHGDSRDAAGAEGVSVYIGGSRGIGGAILTRGQLLRGSHGAAGEFGHWSIDRSGISCWCGRRGCLATRAELGRMLAHSGLFDADLADKMASREPDRVVRELVVAADGGNDQVLDTLTAAGDALGALIDGVHTMVNPDQVLIGGYLGALGAYLEPAIRSRFEVGVSTAPKESLQITLLRDGDDSIVDGALASAQRLCLSHPLHFTHGLSLAG